MTPHQGTPRPLCGLVAVVVVTCAACPAVRASEPGSASVVPTSPPASTSLLVLTTPPTSTTPTRDPAPTRCELAGPKATMKVVVAAGTDELTVAIAGAPVTVVPGEGGPSAVAVQGALEFAGRADDLEFFPSSPVVVANGVVQLGPMSVLGETSIKGTDLVAKTVDIGPGFRLGELSVPCAALAFVGSGHPSEEAHRGVRKPSLRSVACRASCAHYSTPESLDFYALPEDGAHVRLTGSTVVSELERRGGWSRVATQDFVHMDGAQLTGWVRRVGLEKIPGGHGFTGGRAFWPPMQEGRGSGRNSGPGVYHGPARIEPDTPVFSAAGGGQRWAIVRDGAAEFEVVFRAGDEWAQIWRAPFIPSLRDAWVRAKAVHTLPAKVKP